MSSELEIFAKFVSVGDMMGDDSSWEIDVAGGSSDTMSAELEENVAGESIDNVSEVDAECDGAVSAVFLNELLLEHFAKNLDFDSLTSFRAVSKLWQKVAALQFQEKAVVVVEMMEGPLPQDATVLEGLKGVKSLQVNICRIDEEMFELGIGVIQLLAPHLKSLILGYCSLPFQPGQIQLESVVKLTCSAGLCSTAPSRILLWLRAVPNLKELVVIRLQEDGRFILEQLLNADGTRNYALIPSLSSLIVTDVVPSRSLPFLINFPQTWERLDLQITDAGRKRKLTTTDDLSLNLQFDDLEELMENNKNSLISLKLNFGVILNNKVLQFGIPKFTNLRELRLVLTYLTFDLDFGKNSRINYTATFPSLEVLSIDIKTIGSRIDRLENIWRTFFSPQVFKGLRVLELNFEKLFKKLLRGRGVEVNWASKMFPNARLKNL